MSFKVQVKWNDREVRKAVSEASAKAVRQSAEHILEETNRVIPHDEGTLMRSGEVSVDGKVAAVSYDTPYAARLHEHPEYHFQQGRKGKYLEDTLIERRDAVLQYLKDNVAKGFK